MGLCLTCDQPPSHYRIRQLTLLPCSDMLTLTQQCEARHPEPETVAGASVGVILAQIIFTAEETLEVFTVLLVILISFSDLCLGKQEQRGTRGILSK